MALLSHQTKTFSFYDHNKKRKESCVQKISSYSTYAKFLEHHTHIVLFVDSSFVLSYGPVTSCYAPRLLCNHPFHFQVDRAMYSLIIKVISLVICSSNDVYCTVQAPPCPRCNMLTLLKNCSVHESNLP